MPQMRKGRPSSTRLCLYPILSVARRAIWIEFAKQAELILAGWQLASSITWGTAIHSPKTPRDLIRLIPVHAEYTCHVPGQIPSRTIRMR